MSAKRVGEAGKSNGKQDGESGQEIGELSPSIYPHIFLTKTINNDALRNNPADITVGYSYGEAMAQQSATCSTWN